MSDLVFATAYTESKKGQTMRRAMEEPLTDSMMRITGALDQGSGWLRMLEQFDLQGGKGVALRVAQLKDNWLRGQSPSRAILKSMAEHSEFGDVLAVVFMSKLLEQKDPVLEAEVMQWAAKNIGHASEEKMKRQQRHADETSMIDFFLHNKIASTAAEAIDYCELLGKPDVLVNSLRKLGYMSFANLTSIGIPAGPAAMIVEMLTVGAECSSAPSPPPTGTAAPCVITFTHQHTVC